MRGRVDLQGNSARGLRIHKASLEPVGSPAGDLNPGLSPNAPPYVPFPLVLTQSPHQAPAMLPTFHSPNQPPCSPPVRDGWDGATTRDPPHLFLPESSLGSSVGPFWTGLGSSPRHLQPCTGQGQPENCFFNADHPGHRPAPRATWGSRGPPKTTSPSVLRAGILNPVGLWIEFKIWMGRKYTTFIVSPLWLQCGDSYTLGNRKPKRGL